MPLSKVRVAFLLAIITLSSSVFSADYDLVISGGRVMDPETRYDAMPAVDKEGSIIPWDAPYSAFIGHPRTAGADAATLRLAREEGVPLMHTLSQLSYWSASHLGDAGL